MTLIAYLQLLLLQNSIKNTASKILTKSYKFKVRERIGGSVSRTPYSEKNNKPC